MGNESVFEVGPYCWQKRGEEDEAGSDQGDDGITCDLLGSFVSSAICMV